VPIAPHRAGLHRAGPVLYCPAHEQYADDAAFQSHMGTSHMGEMRAAFPDLFATTQVKVERLERLAGFTRGS